MKILSPLLIGYGLGSFSPAALVSKLKHTDLRSQGPGNMGGSTTMLVIGRGWGMLVMLLDILKGYFSVRIARWLFPQAAVAALLAGLGSVLGHVFPFTMRFRGGKGLAAFGGMILAWDRSVFLFLLLLGGAIMFLTNASVAMPLTAAFLFPILVLLKTADPFQFLIAAAASALIAVMHWSDIHKIRSGKGLDMRAFFRNRLRDRSER